MTLIMKVCNLVSRLFLVSIFILISIISNAQENYLSGYVLQLNGDTLKGFIDYRNWDKNPDKVDFKSSLDDNSTSFSNRQIKEFGVSDEVYVSAIVQSDIATVRVNVLDDNGEMILDTISVFLETVISGSKSLFCYKNANGKIEYYIKHDMNYVLLIYKEYSGIQNGKPGIIENKRYLNQLSAYLQDCSTIQSKLIHADYARSYLEEVFQYYYSCTNSVIKFKKEKEGLILDFGLFTGFSLTNLKIRCNEPAFNYLSNVEYKKSLKLTGGLSLDIIFPRSRQRWSVYNELQFVSFKFNGKYLDVLNASNSTENNTELKASYLKLNNMIRYKGLIGRTTFFVNAGISNGLAIDVVNNNRKVVKYYTTTTIEEEKALSGFRAHEQSFLAGLGVRMNKFSFEVRIENGNGFSDFRYLETSVTKYGLLVGYVF